MAFETTAVSPPEQRESHKLPEPEAGEKEGKGNAAENPSPEAEMTEDKTNSVDGPEPGATGAELTEGNIKLADPSPENKLPSLLTIETLAPQREAEAEELVAEGLHNSPRQAGEPKPALMINRNHRDAMCLASLEYQ